MPPIRRRFWFEVGLGALSLILLVLTLVWKDWIEVVFDVDPDSGDGSFEAGLTIATVATFVASTAVACWDYRRSRTVAE
jgi:hypothetical protein